MSSIVTAQAPLETIAFPPVQVAGELQHIFCNAGDAHGFLASAAAWLELFVLAQDSTLAADEIWATAQEVHDKALLAVTDPVWRRNLLDQLDHSLFKRATYQRLWGQLAAFAGQSRAIH